MAVGCKLLTLLLQQRGEQKSKNCGQGSFLPWVSEWRHVYSVWLQSLCHLPFFIFISYSAYKGRYSQSYGFSSSQVQMWELDHKKDGVPKNWCFELWCWRRLLRVPWTGRRSNQSILKEISPEYSLEGLMLKLKLWCEELTHWKRPWCWERLRAEEKRVSEDEMARWHHQSNRHKTWANFRRWRRTEGLVCCSPWLDWTTEQQEKYTLTNFFLLHNHGFLFSGKLAQSGNNWQGHAVKLLMVKGLCIVCPGKRGCSLPP